MFLANFSFVVSHLKIHSAVHLNTSKALMSLYLKGKVYQKFTSFCCVLRKDKMVAERPDVQIKQAKSMI